ncbi:MAG: ribosome maturation factor RimM [Saprospiraceae bacterium]|nr:ribosome maturation factor RimM [Saprospiraceae bacterium]
MGEKRDWETIPGFTRIGVVGKTHGAAGEVKIHIDDAYLEIALETSFLFVDRAGSQVPYEVEGRRIARGLVVKLSGIDDTGQAALLTGAAVSLPGSVSTPQDDDEIGLEYAHLTGYTMVDKKWGSLGRIKTVTAFPQQEMAVLDYQDQEVLVPLNQAFITSVDSSQQSVVVDLPAGLLDQ